MTAAIPMPLRSATALGTVAASALPLTPAGTTYTMAQEAAFVDERHYFDVAFAARDGGPTWFLCSTEEGALWMGQVEAGGKLVVGGYERIGLAALGSALCASGHRIAATAYDLHEFLLG